MKHFFVLFVFLSTFSFAQNSADFNKVESDYELYLNNTFNPIFNSTFKSKRHKYNFKQHHLNFIIDSTLISKYTTFAVGQKSELKLMAAILYSLKNNSSYKYMVDGYDAFDGKTKFKLREINEISLSVIPDTNFLEELSIQDLGNNKQFVKYKVTKLKRLDNPIVLQVYNDYNERGKLNFSVKKISIRVEGKLWFSSTTRNEVNTVYLNGQYLNEWSLYKYKRFNFLIQGGLFNHFLLQSIDYINHEANMKSNYLRNTTDIYNDQIIELTRMLSFGRYLGIKSWRFTLL